ncbi:MAG: glycosyltransferase family 2 protein [Candidatus Eisenbacteria bacterium]
MPNLPDSSTSSRGRDVELSVCVVSYKRKDLIVKCLDAVMSTVRSCAFEVLVCDNASQDGSVELIGNRCPDVRLIENGGNVGFGAANNQLMNRALGDFVLLLNNDCIVQEGAIDAMVEFLRHHPQAAIAGGKVIFPDGVLQPSFQQRLEDPLANYTFMRWSRAKRQEKVLSSHRSVSERLRVSALYAREQRYDRDQEVAVVIGAFMMIRRKFIAEEGGFDGRYFMYREDSDLCVRASRAGWKVFYCHGALAEHHHITRYARDPARARFLEAAYCESQLRFCQEHFAVWKTYLLAIALCAVAVLRMCSLGAALLWSRRRLRTTELFGIQLRLIPLILRTLAERSPAGGCEARRT